MEENSFGKLATIFGGGLAAIGLFGGGALYGNIAGALGGLFTLGSAGLLMAGIISGNLGQVWEDFLTWAGQTSGALKKGDGDGPGQSASPGVNIGRELSESGPEALGIGGGALATGLAGKKVVSRVWNHSSYKKYNAAMEVLKRFESDLNYKPTLHDADTINDALGDPKARDMIDKAQKRRWLWTRGPKEKDLVKRMRGVVHSAVSGERQPAVQTDQQANKQQAAAEEADTTKKQQIDAEAARKNGSGVIDVDQQGIRDAQTGQPLETKPQNDIEPIKPNQDGAPEVKIIEAEDGRTALQVEDGGKPRVLGKGEKLMITADNAGKITVGVIEGDVASHLSGEGYEARNIIEIDDNGNPKRHVHKSGVERSYHNWADEKMLNQQLGEFNEQYGKQTEAANKPAGAPDAAENKPAPAEQGASKTNSGRPSETANPRGQGDLNGKNRVQTATATGEGNIPAHLRSRGIDLPTSPAASADAKPGSLMDEIAKTAKNDVKNDRMPLPGTTKNEAVINAPESVDTKPRGTVADTLTTARSATTSTKAAHARVGAGTNAVFALMDVQRFLNAENDYQRQSAASSLMLNGGATIDDGVVAFSKPVAEYAKASGNFTKLSGFISKHAGTLSKYAGPAGMAATVIDTGARVATIGYEGGVDYKQEQTETVVGTGAGLATGLGGVALAGGSVPGIGLAIVAGVAVTYGVNAGMNHVDDKLYGAEDRRFQPNPKTKNYMWSFVSTSKFGNQLPKDPKTGEVNLYDTGTYNELLGLLQKEIEKREGEMDENSSHLPRMVRGNKNEVAKHLLNVSPTSILPGANKLIEYGLDAEAYREDGKDKLELQEAARADMNIAKAAKQELEWHIEDVQFMRRYMEKVNSISVDTDGDDVVDWVKLDRNGDGEVSLADKKLIQEEFNDDQVFDRFMQVLASQGVTMMNAQEQELADLMAQMAEKAKAEAKQDAFKDTGPENCIGGHPDKDEYLATDYSKLKDMLAASKNNNSNHSLEFEPMGDEVQQAFIDVLRDSLAEKGEQVATTEQPSTSSLAGLPQPVKNNNEQDRL